MAFSALATFGVAIIAVLIIAAGMSPLAAVPVALFVGAVAVSGWLLLGRLRNRRIVSGAGPSGVPSTRDASYDPQLRS